MASLQFDLSAAMEKIAETKAVLVDFDRAEGDRRKAHAHEALAFVREAQTWLEGVRGVLAREAGVTDA